MSDELIKRLRIRAQQYMKSGLHDQASMLTEAADALSRPAPAVQVPDGRKLVPVEPTLEQISAAREETDRQFDAYGERPDHDDIYRVMVAAAPSAPVAVAQPASPSLDAEKVMGLVEEYGAEMKDLGQHTAEGYALGIMQDEKEAARLHAQIRALLTPATCKEVLQVAGWIPVGEMLPDMEAGYVLVHCEGGKIGDDFFCRNREFLHHSGNRYSRKHQGKESGYFQSSHMYGYRITHWQPLPPPPAIANQEARDEANS